MTLVGWLDHSGEGQLTQPSSRQCARHQGPSDVDVHNCFEGNETWLNTVDRGRDYAAGDLWGCVGMWFSGRWYTQPAVDYIAAVQDWLNQRIWETPDFLGYG